MGRRKDILIVAMVFALCGMAAAYAMLSQKVDSENKDRFRSGQWAVEITNIETVATQGRGMSESVNSNVTTAFFSTSLHQAGDSVTYAVTVENKGLLDAKLESITSTAGDELGKDDMPYIIYTYDGISSESVLASGETITFTVTVQCNPDVTIITDTNFNLTTVLNYVQNE